MAHEQRTVGHNVIDVFVTVDVIDFAALATGDERRYTADTAEGAHGAVNAAGDILACFLKAA